MSTAYYNTGKTLLDGFAIERRNQASMLIAEKIAPMVPVDINSKSYPIWGNEFLQLSANSGRRAPSAEAERVDVTFSTDTYSTQEVAFETALDVRDQANAQPELRVEKQKINLITDKQLLTREAACAVKLFNSTTFSGYYAALSGATDKWSNASSNPITQVNIAKDSIRRNGVVDPENLHLFINNATWQALRANPAIVAITKYSTYQLLTTDVVAAALGLKGIHIGSGVKDVSGVKTDIWGNYALFGFLNDAPELEDVSMAKTFILKEKDMRIDSWYDQKLSSWFWRSKWDYDIKATAASSGYLFGTVI
jgi:hypothetical protein